MFHAPKRTRTSTTAKPQGSQPCASTNSAIDAKPYQNGEIRTLDLSLPKGMRYQAALRSVILAAASHFSGN